MKPPTILAVDDDAIARNLIVQALSGLGFRVFEADSAAEALLVCRTLKDQPLDMLIVEYSPPSFLGRELAEQILRCCPKVKVLHLSEQPYSRMQEENGLLPGSSFLQKPFTGQQLIVTVQGLFGSRPH